MSSISNNSTTTNLPLNMGRLFAVLSGTFLSILTLTIFQDFLESKRTGVNFNFDESMLFKILWLLFIPIVLFLYKILQHERLDNYAKTTAFIVSAITIHLLVLPFVAVVFSVLFYEGRYGLYKFISYTLAHDLYKLVIVYTSFILAYNYFLGLTQNENKPALDTIVINNGKENTIVNIEDIVQITSATPYIFIHLENKKYLHSETLKSIYQQLDSNVFVRVHKSTVVNILKISSFKSRLNGDYDLQLRSGELVRLSRTYASDFKSRFNASQRVNV